MKSSICKVRVCEYATDSAQIKNQQIQVTEIRNAHKAKGSMCLTGMKSMTNEKSEQSRHIYEDEVSFTRVTMIGGSESQL